MRGACFIGQIFQASCVLREKMVFGLVSFFVRCMGMVALERKARV